MAFDPALPVKNPELETSSAILAYARVLDLWGKSGKIDVIMPYTWLSGSAELDGERVDRISGIWASIDATYFTGGRTIINGTPNRDWQRNWRVGSTLALPLDRRDSMKLYASSGVAARTGNNFDLIGIAWQHRWGSGL